MDKFTNNLGIVFGSICALVVVGWITGRLKVSGFWQVLTFIATPLLLVYFLVNEIITIAREGYEGYSSIQIGLFGWAVLGIILLGSFLMPLVAFRGNKYLDSMETSDYGVSVGAALLEPRTRFLQVRRQTPPPKAQVTMLWPVSGELGTAPGTDDETLSHRVH